MPYEYLGHDSGTESRLSGPWDAGCVEPGTIYIRMSAPRSAMPAPARRMLLIAAVAALLMSIHFALMGAWPVLLFSALDIGGLAAALVMFARSQPRREHLRINREQIALVRYDERGKGSTLTMPTFWTRVEAVSRTDLDCTLYLVFRQRRVVIANCLSDAERRALAPRLTDALGTCR